MKKLYVLSALAVLTNGIFQYINYTLKPSVKEKKIVNEAGKPTHVFGIYKGKKAESIINKDADVSSRPEYKLRGVIISKEKTVAIVDEGYDKSHIVEVGQSINDARVLKIDETVVVVKQNGVTSRIEIREPATAEYAPELISTESLDAEAPENKYQISKEKIKMYMSNVKEVWKNILFSRKDGYIKVSYLNKKGEFANLGLMKGDELLTIDDEQLSTFKLLELYRKSDEIEHLKLGIRRGLTIIELNYEIK